MNRKDAKNAKKKARGNYFLRLDDLRVFAVGFT
jgi:hypothetical protein